MELVDFIRSDLQRLHRGLGRSLADVSDEQAHTAPAGKGNSIAFTLWHYARTEDNIVRFILQSRRPTVWMEGQWAEKLGGMPPVAQGTGMSLADAQALHIKDLNALRQYMQTVWQSTETYLANPDTSTFDALVTVKPLGEMPAILALGQVCLTHGFSHLGEIDHIRTMLGLSGLGI